MTTSPGRPLAGLWAAAQTFDTALPELFADGDCGERRTGGEGIGSLTAAYGVGAGVEQGLAGGLGFSRGGEVTGGGLVDGIRGHARSIAQEYFGINIRNPLALGPVGVP